VGRIHDTQLVRVITIVTEPHLVLVNADMSFINVAVLDTLWN
jgi:hypothetical protein